MMDGDGRWWMMMDDGWWMMDGDDDGNNDDDHDDEREKNSILDRVQFKEKSFQVLVQPLVYIYIPPLSDGNPPPYFWAKTGF